MAEERRMRTRVRLGAHPGFGKGGVARKDSAVAPDGIGADLELAGPAIGEEMLQGFLYRRESDFSPGNFLLTEQRHFQRFLSRTEHRLFQVGAEEHVHLVDMGNVDHGIEAGVFDTGIGLFQTLADRTLNGGFTVFQKTRRQGPVAAPGSDGAFAQQDALTVYGHAAGDNAGILVMYGFAVIADVAVPVVPGGNPEADYTAARTTEIHDRRSIRDWRWCAAAGGALARLSAPVS